MTYSGRRWALLFGVILALALPKRIEAPEIGRCRKYVMEPLGFYLLGQVFGDLGITYTAGQDCR